LTHLNDYLQEYGRRIDKLYVSGASWIEDPTPVLRMLKGYMAQPDRDLIGEMEKVLIHRQQCVVEARERLATFPQPIVAQFETLLTAAQQACFLKEEHTHWIDFQATYHAHQVLLEFGRRLQDAGVIESRDDVFYLTLNELKETVAAEPFPPRHRLIRERRALEAQYAACTPPPRLGPLPSAPPPDNSVMRAVGKVFGAPPPSPQAPGELLGLAASPGTVRGPVKILHTLTEADKLEPGDILVAATTTPPWTPLFANIAGVISDAGGILSHPAVVAREYGIPAVVGTGQATTMLQDGQVVEVDGSAGVVRVVSQQ
jgi:phosphohistidine swiveling domain-containing protein